MLNILADENILLAKKVFSPFGKVTLLPGREITKRSIKKTEILIVRSITKVDRNLLENTNIRFVGSATIGVDHLDINYLNEKKIYNCNSPGSNSYSVAEYVITALLNLAVKYNFSLKDKSIGIIGVGNIGSKVANFAKAFEMNILLNDPPLKELTPNKKYLPLKELLNADILTLHVPYTTKGKHKTHHLFDFNILKNFKDNSILINTSRGSVVNNAALIKVIKSKNLISVLDVWENEPNINLNLLKLVDIGTPHIAGYTLNGKINGTKAVYNHLCKFLNQKPEWNFEEPAGISKDLTFRDFGNVENTLLSIIKNIYDINDDYQNLLNILMCKKNIFDDLRKNYKTRREFVNYNILINSKYGKEKEMLDKLRFKTIVI